MVQKNLRVKWYLKNIHSTILKEKPNYLFKIVGAGNQSAILEEIKDISQVEFTGKVKDIAKEILSACVCVAPLVSGAGFRGKVTQYASLCKATVTTSIGACGLILKNGRDIIVQDDPQNFAESIVELLDNVEKRKSMEQSAYNITRSHYSWEKKLKELESLY